MIFRRALIWGVAALSIAVMAEEGPSPRHACDAACQKAKTDRINAKAAAKAAKETARNTFRQNKATRQQNEANAKTAAASAKSAARSAKESARTTFRDSKATRQQNEANAKTAAFNAKVGKAAAKLQSQTAKKNAKVDARKPREDAREQRGKTKAAAKLAKANAKAAREAAKTAFLAEKAEGKLNAALSQKKRDASDHCVLSDDVTYDSSSSHLSVSRPEDIPASGWYVIADSDAITGVSGDTTGEMAGGAWQISGWGSWWIEGSGDGDDEQCEAWMHATVEFDGDASGVDFYYCYAVSEGMDMC